MVSNFSFETFSTNDGTPASVQIKCHFSKKKAGLLGSEICSAMGEGTRCPGRKVGASKEYTLPGLGVLFTNMGLIGKLEWKEYCSLRMLPP